MSHLDKYVVQCEPGDIERHRPIAILAYLPFMCFISLALAPRSKFVRFHAYQGLMLLITEGLLGTLLACAELAFLFYHPHGAPIAVAMWLFFLFVIAAYIAIGLRHAFQGICEPLPLIGQWKLISRD